MPRPIPSYVPSPVTAILRQKRWGLKDVARTTNLKYGTIVHFFKNNGHHEYRRFKRLCDALSISIETGVSIHQMPDGARQYKFDELIRAHFSTYEECANSVGISGDYLYDVIGGRSGGIKKILELYKPIGDALDVRLADMPATIFDVK